MIDIIDVTVTVGPEHKYKTKIDPIDLRIMESDYWKAFIGSTPDSKPYERCYSTQSDRNYKDALAQIAKPEGLTLRELKTLGSKHEKLQPHHRQILYDLRYARFFLDHRFWNQFALKELHPNRILMGMMDGFISNYTAQETAELLMHGKYITPEHDRDQWNKMSYNDRPELMEAQEVIWPIIALMLKLTKGRELTHTHHDIMLALLGSLGLRTREIMDDLRKRYERPCVLKKQFDQILGVFNDLEGRPLDLKPQLYHYNMRRYRERAESKWKKPPPPASYDKKIRDDKKIDTEKKRNVGRGGVKKPIVEDAGYRNQNQNATSRRHTQMDDIHDYGELGID